MKRAIIAVLLLACTQTAHAQQPADLKVINDCLAKAEKGESLGTACIGLVADACMRKTENDTVKNRACAARELAVWTALSEAAGKRVRAGGFKDISKALADSDKNWTQHRDALCPVFDKVEPGFLPGDAAYCRLQVTAHRVLLLRRLGNAVNEH